MAAKVLIVDDESGLREMLEVLFKRAGYDCSVVSRVADAKRVLGTSSPFDVLVSDLVMPDGSGMDVLEAARARDVSTQVVLITAYATTEAAVEAMRRGAYDYIQKPFKNSELLATVEKALEKRALVEQNRSLRERVRAGYGLGELVGKSRAMTQVMDLVHRVADSKSSVLITGESGTGKEVVARAIHTQGARANAPFVVVNCGALPEALMESELFGHEKGAFTGAHQKHDGLFRRANTGTLLLDEVGELSPTLQVKLLRVLQDHRVRPVGASEEVEVDVRVIAATNRDLERDVKEGRFRQDLYYRLDVIHLHMPRLADRADDIPLLAEYFLRKHASTAGKLVAFSPEAMHALLQHTYPGNVRELENAVERAVTLASGDRVVRSDLPDAFLRGSLNTIESVPADGFDLDAHLQAVEKTLLVSALERAGGVRTKAAKLVGMTFRSFRYRLQKYGLADENEESDDGSAT